MKVMFWHGSFNMLMFVSSRSIAEESICDPDNSGDATLVALRLDNNYIDPKKVSPSAFSCVCSSSSVVLKPQKTKWRELHHTPETLVQIQDLSFFVRSTHWSYVLLKANKQEIHRKKALMFTSNVQAEVNVHAVPADVMCLKGEQPPVLSYSWTESLQVVFPPLLLIHGFRFAKYFCTVTWHNGDRNPSDIKIKHICLLQ